MKKIKLLIPAIAATALTAATVLPLASCHKYVGVTSVTLDLTSTSLEVQTMKTLAVTVSPANATNKAVTWTSDDEDVAKVNENGVITAIEAGTAKITCTSVDNPNAKATCNITVVEQKGIDKIVVTTQPTKTSYVEGQCLDLKGLVVTAAYTDGTSATIPDTLYTTNPSKDDILVEGQSSVTVTYRSKTDSFPITVAKKKLVTIGVTTEPTKKTYIEHQKLDLSGMVVTAYYDNGTTSTVQYTSTSPTTEQQLQLNDNKVTVYYEELGVTKTAEFFITVNAMKLQEIKLEGSWKHDDYKEGDKLNLDGMIVKAVFDNGETPVVTDYKTNPSINDPLKPTDTNVTVSYTCGGITKTKDFTISVAAKELDSITIKSEPTKTHYLEGDKLDTAGLVITAHYDNETTEDITEGFVTDPLPTDSLKPTDTKVTVSYTHGQKTREAEFNITVDEKTITSVELQTTESFKTSYIEGQKIDLTGLTVIAYYDNGTTETVTDYDTYPGKETPLTTDNNEIVISVTRREIVKQAKISITVAPKSLKEIKLTGTYKTKYLTTETLDLNGLVVTAYYDNGANKEVDTYTTNPPLGQLLKTTDTEVTVTYEEGDSVATASYPITVTQQKAFDISGSHNVDIDVSSTMTFTASDGVLCDWKIDDSSLGSFTNPEGGSTTGTLELTDTAKTCGGVATIYATSKADGYKASYKISIGSFAKLDADSLKSGWAKPINNEITGNIIIPSKYYYTDGTLQEKDITTILPFRGNLNTISRFYIPSTVTSLSTSSTTQGIFYDTDIEDMVVSPNNSIYTSQIDKTEHHCIIYKNSPSMLAYGCMNTTLPDCVTFISQFAFQKVNFTNGEPKFNFNNIVQTSNYSFAESNIKTVTFGSSLTSIGESTFDGCTALTNVSIPTSCANIYKNAFNGCTALYNTTALATCGVAFETKAIKWKSSNHFWSVGDEDCYAQNGKFLALTYASESWQKSDNEYTCNVEESTLSASISASTSFSETDLNLFNDYLVTNDKETLVYPITAIAETGFSGQNSLKTIDLTNLTNITEIRNKAFNYCSNLESIKIGKSVTTLGEYLLEDCTKLNTIDLTVFEAEYELPEWQSCQHAFDGINSSASTRQIKVAAGMEAAWERLFNDMGWSHEGWTIVVA